MLNEQTYAKMSPLSFSNCLATSGSLNAILHQHRGFFRPLGDHLTGRDGNLRIVKTAGSTAANARGRKEFDCHVDFSRS